MRVIPVPRQILILFGMRVSNAYSLFLCVTFKTLKQYQKCIYVHKHNVLGLNKHNYHFYVDVCNEWSEKTVFDKQNDISN